MASIGKQIVAARKAKGMTQDALSEALNVSRAAVSQWERDRRMPDAETLLRLSALLEYSFEDEASKAPDTVPQEKEQSTAEVLSTNTASTDVSHVNNISSSRGVSTIRKKRWILICLAAAAVVICTAIVLPRILNRGKSPSVFYADDGTPYTIEQFQQETPRVDGKAWLLGETNLKTITSDGSKVWMYDFIFHEMNGIGLTIDRLEACTFYGDKVLPMVIPGEELSLYGLTNSISPRGEWKETGGLPVSDNVRGAGITLYCTDDNGEAITFSNYITLNPEK